MGYAEELDLDVCLGKISQQDEYAVEELYRAMSNPIYRFSLMTIGDDRLAEDAMQETFLRIMAYSGTYKMGTNARAWIFRIARNACIDVMSKKLPIEDDEVLERVADEYRINDTTETIALKEAVAKLTSKEREVLSLHVYSGLKQTEIASVMGISYVKVRSHYKYAIQKLRKELSEK